MCEVSVDYVVYNGCISWNLYLRIELAPRSIIVNSNYWFGRPAATGAESTAFPPTSNTTPRVTVVALKNKSDSNERSENIDSSRLESQMCS